MCKPLGPGRSLSVKSIGLWPQCAQPRCEFLWTLAEVGSCVPVSISQSVTVSHKPRANEALHIGRLLPIGTCRHLSAKTCQMLAQRDRARTHAGCSYQARLNRVLCADVSRFPGFGARGGLARSTSR